MSNCLLIGSNQGCSGKSALIIGIADRLQQKGINIAYRKPLGTFMSKQNGGLIEEDIKFVSEILNLAPGDIPAPLLFLNEETVRDRIKAETSKNYAEELPSHVASHGQLVLIEGAGSLNYGALFGLSLEQMSQQLNAPVLLLCNYGNPELIDSLMTSHSSLGDRLAGVVINDIPPELLPQFTKEVKPFLETQGIKVLATMPMDRVLRSISVRQVVERLGAEVICREDRLDLIIESLTIGAMNVNSALRYFKQKLNKAVVTGGDRQDLQLAALETSTSCLILTGHIPPTEAVKERANALEVPIISVTLDTLTAVEIIDQAFGKVRLQEPLKVTRMKELTAEYFDIDRLISTLNLS
ncbi:MAG: phosphotransacetylase family protein [Synechococcaceae cyanobacterium RL_1_2]|nr:phosphotransacetylase family protein [Synechococcaceae cyanobacterium RL_1_2]